MATQPTLRQLEQALRSNVCTSCPFRTECIEGEGLARKCEADCPLFVNLPGLAKRAGLLDPMLARHENVLRDAMRKIIADSEEEAGKRLQRCHHKAAKVLADMIK
jgi:hypothetical protein